MNTLEGFWEITPKIKKIQFLIRGKMHVTLEDKRVIIVPLAAFPSIKKVPLNQRNKWYLVGGGVTWDACPEVIHIEQILGNYQKYKHT